MENKRNRGDIQLCNSNQKMVKAASCPRFRDAKIFNNDLAAAIMSKINIELDTPIAIGATVLELSKLIMYRLAYEQLPKYEHQFNCKIDIVGGDTDSFFLEVGGADLLNPIYPAMLADGLLDTSNYPRDHPLFSNEYKAKLGCVKDEFMGKAYAEFILLRPKSYSMLDATGAAGKQVCKGIAKRRLKPLHMMIIVKFLIYRPKNKPCGEECNQSSMLSTQ